MCLWRVLQTIQVTLLTLHEHIDSSPIITDYTSNTAYPSWTHWFISHYYRLQVTLRTLHEDIGSSPIITDYTSNTKGKQCYLYSL
jgi:succinate dehydrogenase hydrophobic anchor subunit